ncbi:MAG TPA: hypothetical protein VHC19_13700 [Pirellulales bacterium]|jgi:WD40 repeat protein|nr:hypothetical protein [Pirellulales bacterium]
MNIDPAKTKQLAEYKHEAPLLCCTFDPSGRFVLAGGRDRSLACLDVATSAQADLEGHESWVGNVVRSGAELVLTADFAGTVIAWDCTGDSPQQRRKIAAHACGIYSLAASHDGTLFATGDRDGAIRIWRAGDGQQLYELHVQDQPVYALAFHPDGQRLISADRQPKKPRLKAWDFAKAKELLNIDVPQLSAYRRYEDIEWGGIRGVTLSADGKTIVACGSNEYSGPACALLFDADTGELKRKLDSTLKGFCYGARYHPQGFLLTASGDIGKGELSLWDVQSDKPLAALATPGPSTSLDIHPDGRRFVVTQTRGKGSYPDSGTLTVFEWEA